MSKIINRKHGDKSQLARALKSNCKLITLQQTLSVYASQYATRKSNGTVNANSFIESNKHNPKCELETYIATAKGKVSEAWVRVQTLAIETVVTNQDDHDALMLACDATIADAMAVTPKKAAKPKNALADAIGLICADMPSLSASQVLQIFHAVMTRMPSKAEIEIFKAEKQSIPITA